MKKAFIAVFAVLLGAVLISSCAKKEPTWRSFISDYEKIADQYLTEMKEVSEGKRQAISPELEAQLKEFGEKYNDIGETLTPMEKIKFMTEFGKVTAKIYASRADDISQMTQTAAEQLSSQLSNAGATN